MNCSIILGEQKDWILHRFDQQRSISFFRSRHCLVRLTNIWTTVEEVSRKAERQLFGYASGERKEIFWAFRAARVRLPEVLSMYRSRPRWVEVQQRSRLLPLHQWMRREDGGELHHLGSVEKSETLKSFSCTLTKNKSADKTIKVNFICCCLNEFRSINSKR